MRERQKEEKRNDISIRAGTMVARTIRVSVSVFPRNGPRARAISQGYLYNPLALPGRSPDTTHGRGCKDNVVDELPRMWLGIAHPTGEPQLTDARVLKRGTPFRRRRTPTSSSIAPRQCQLRDLEARGKAKVCYMSRSSGQLGAPHLRRSAQIAPVLCSSNQRLEITSSRPQTYLAHVKNKIEPLSRCRVSCSFPRLPGG